MEETVDPGIAQTFGSNDGLEQDSVYSNVLLMLEWPKLLGLAYLQDKGQNWTSHLVLRQDPSVFETLQDKADLFVNIAKYIIPHSAVQMTKPTGEPSCGQNLQRQDDTAQARECFCSYSKRLFTGIARRLAGCQPPHKALLHLKGPSDAHDGEPTPKLSMFMAFCPERDTWHQVVCSEHVAGTGSALDDSFTDVDDICQLARSYSETGCILGVKLKGDTLLDTSDQSMDEELSLLDNISVTKFTLDELLRQGIFQNAHGVYPNDKKILEYILARALLCLYGGPWLQTPWSADKLVFRYDVAAQTIHDVHHPYILCDLLEDLPPPVSRSLHQSPPVLAFAKILVDLDQGWTNETMDASDRALFKTLKKYYNDNKDKHFSPGYSKALHSSIFFNEHFREIRSKDPNATIQDAILEGIVKPLEREVHMEKKDQWGSVRTPNTHKAKASKQCSVSRQKIIIFIWNSWSSWNQDWEYLQHTEDDTPIRVAVIDTGIDRGHADFQRARTKNFLGQKPNPVQYEQPQKDRIRVCKNFCKDQPEDDVTDLDGHGTQVAGIILRLAPNAELYIARVCTSDINHGLEPDKKQQRRPGYRDFQRTEIEELSTMLWGAKNTIIFATTSNHGSHNEVAWPARDPRAAIAIHSSLDSGTRASDFCARALAHNDNFMTVGESILSQWPTVKGGGFRLCSGTSFATPVASAVGAIILGFAQEQSQSQFRQQAEKKVDLEELRTMDGMRKVLRKISEIDNSGYSWIHSKLFWSNFKDIGQNDKAFQHAWDIITEALRT
ncbi:hypothetical protein SEUCBS140593_009918 [Sporothrix eucalyptigena]|uniref:Peptidase S8/S53 domain-containing protein n=1 Tax=Sporothrix eucalyptigena TaxID=1812306 RepID=A0ABP0D0L9_9PEZI